FVTYEATSSGQLLVTFGKISPEDSEAEILSKTMVVENFDYGGNADAYGITDFGDLGMRFRIATDKGDEISLWNSVWGTLIQYLQSLYAFAKMIAWVPAEDPLVLDLDGDGIETGDEDGGVY